MTSPAAVLWDLDGTLVDTEPLWMAEEAAHGCLFHAAVAADPDSARLRALLQRHKAEVAERAASACGLPGREAELLLLIEGLTQSWPLHGAQAIAAAQRLGRALIQAPH